MTAEPLRSADEVNDALNVAVKQDDSGKPTRNKPVPKSWKPVIASKADGSPVLIFVSPKVEAAIKAATA